MSQARQTRENACGRSGFCAAAIFAGACVLAALAPSAARAEGRAAVLVTTEGSLDPFVSAYAFEVASAVLAASRFVVAPRGVTSARVGARTPSGATCITTPACLAAVATDVGSPTLVAIHLAADARGAFDARVATFEVTEAGPSEIESGTVHGNETAIAERVRDVVTRLAERPAPCTVTVTSQAGTPHIAVAHGRADARTVLFVTEGTHALRIDVARRAGWSGELTCRAGRRYRIDVR